MGRGDTVKFLQVLSCRVPITFGSGFCGNVDRPVEVRIGGTPGFCLCFPQAPLDIDPYALRQELLRISVSLQLIFPQHVRNRIHTVGNRRPVVDVIVCAVQPVNMTV